MKIELLATNLETSQYSHATNLKSKFENWLKHRKDKDDEIFIAPNFRLYGENIRDIDILVFGVLDKGMSMKLDFIDKENKARTSSVYIGSFCFAIDIREENIESISEIKDKIWIKANGRSANFSAYNTSIYGSLRRYMSNSFEKKGDIPFIATCLNFINIPSRGVSSTYPNFIRGELTIDKLFQSYAYASTPNQSTSKNGSRGYYYLNSLFRSQENGSYEKFKNLVSEYSTIISKIGPLTKLKLDVFSKNRVDLPQYYDSIGKELVILKGGAGTGKTMKLLNIAKKLYESGNRCLILTYNRALVNDINRILDINRTKSDPLSETIKIETIHSFLKPIVNEIIHWEDDYIKDEIQGGKENPSLKSGDGSAEEKYKIIKSKSRIYYLTYYNEILISAAEELSSFNIPTDDPQNSACAQSITNYDYILIDEAQDWQKEERDILYFLFGSQKIIIADGLQQLIRTNSPLNWKVSNNRTIKSKEVVFPKKSLRQNEKLCLLQNFIANKYTVPWDVVKNEKLRKGTISVYVGDINEQIAGYLKDFTKDYSDDKYDDLLFLAPPSMIAKTSVKTRFNKEEKTLFFDDIQKRSFKYTKDWEKLGLNISDLTFVDNQNSHTQEGEYRLISYDSCRGLESFGVVALEMDTFFANKIKHYKEDLETIKQGDIFTQDREQKALRYAAMWALIVMSRPVELLVITIKDKNSIFYNLLKEISNNTEDVIRIIE